MDQGFEEAMVGKRFVFLAFYLPQPILLHTGYCLKTRIHIALHYQLHDRSTRQRIIVTVGVHARIWHGSCTYTEGKNSLHQGSEHVIEIS